MNTDKNFNRRPAIRVLKERRGAPCPKCGEFRDLVSIRGAEPVWACKNHGQV